jgi:hypothetical protein
MKLSDYIAVALLSSAEDTLSKGHASDVYFSLDQARGAVREVLSSGYPGPVLEQLEAAFEQLLAAGLVEPFRTPHAAPRYRFIWEAIAEFGERATKDDPAFSGALWAFKNLGINWLRESYQAALKDPDASEILSPDAFGAIPASDRYVTLSDNSKESVGTHLTELARRISADNEAPIDTREIALSEISAFEATILQPRVSAELIDRFVRRVITWIVRAFSAALVSDIAEKLITELLKLI